MVSFDVSLGFTVDEEIKRYIDHVNSQYGEDGNGSFRAKSNFSLGLLGVTINTGTHYAIIDLSVASSDHNRIFQYSTSVREAMFHLMDSCRGIVALLDMEIGDDDTVSLSALNDQQIVLKIDRDGSQDLTDVDVVVMEVIRQLDSK